MTVGERPSRVWSGRFLCLSPFLIALVGGLRLLGVAAPLRHGCATLLIAAILLAAWQFGVRILRAAEPERRRLAAAGGLLTAVLAAITVFADLGPPESASLAENQLRYPLLLLAAIAVAGALMLLAESLREAGERFHSGLGLAAIVMAGPLYVLFAAMQLLEYRTLASNGASEMTPELALLDQLSLLLLFFGALLTYLATAAFAASMGRAQWLGRRASRVYVSISLIAAICVAIRATEALAGSQNPLWGFLHWSSLPGFVLLIPAMPWLMPCLLGIVLLRRAGAER